MEEWVVLRLPAALALFGGGLFFSLFEQKYRASGGCFHRISAVLVLSGTAYSLVHGASARECAMVLLMFLLPILEVKA